MKGFHLLKPSASYPLCGRPSDRQSAFALCRRSRTRLKGLPGLVIVGLRRKRLVRLSELTIFELRGEWRRLHRTPPPMRLSRDLLTRGIIYKLQERAYGGLSKAAARKLEQAAGPPSRGAAKPTPSVSLRPGTRLLREWRGVTHTALIHADGIEWRGQRYSSLVSARPAEGVFLVKDRHR